MSPRNPSAALPPRSRALARTPVVRRAGQWWLVSGAGSIPATDPVFAGQLDRFAAAMAAADQAVADLRAPQDAPLPPGSTGQR